MNIFRYEQQVKHIVTDLLSIISAVICFDWWSSLSCFICSGSDLFFFDLKEIPSSWSSTWFLLWCSCCDHCDWIHYLQKEDRWEDKADFVGLWVDAFFYSHWTLNLFVAGCGWRCCCRGGERTCRASAKMPRQVKSVLGPGFQCCCCCWCVCSRATGKPQLRVNSNRVNKMMLKSIQMWSSLSWLYHTVSSSSYYSKAQSQSLLRMTVG